MKVNRSSLVVVLVTIVTIVYGSNMKHRTRLTRHQTFDLHQKLPLFSVTIKSSLTNKNGQMFISLYENFVLTCNFTGNLEPKLSDEIPTRLRWTPKIKFFHSNIELGGFECMTKCKSKW